MSKLIGGVLIALVLSFVCYAEESPKITVGPITATIVPIAFDVYDNGLGGSADMIGPKIGNVAYTQGSDGSLNISFGVMFAASNMTYTAYLTCGPAHSLACGYIVIGSVSTSDSGTSQTTISVPVSTLQSSPFGCGMRTDHLDLIASGVLTVGAVNYYVPCTPGTAPVPAGGRTGGDPTRK